MGRLGFYSDDREFLAAFALGPDRSFAGLFWSVYAQPFEVMRPVKILYTTAFYWCFGVGPVGYHAVNAVVLGVSVILLALVLRDVLGSRALSLAVALVWALLPHYSTDRFWFAAFQANLSMALYFLSLHADLRAVEASGRRVWAWKGIGLAALLGSALSYEVALPLFLVNFVLVGRRSQRLRGARPGPPPSGLAPTSRRTWSPSPWSSPSRPSRRTASTGVASRTSDGSART